MACRIANGRIESCSMQPSAVIGAKNSRTSDFTQARQDGRISDEDLAQILAKNLRPSMEDEVALEEFSPEESFKFIATQRNRLSTIKESFSEQDVHANDDKETERYLQPAV